VMLKINWFAVRSRTDCAQKALSWLTEYPRSRDSSGQEYAQAQTGRFFHWWPRYSQMLWQRLSLEISKPGSGRTAIKSLLMIGGGGALTTLNPPHRPVTAKVLRESSVLLSTSQHRDDSLREEEIHHRACRPKVSARKWQGWSWVCLPGLSYSESQNPRHPPQADSVICSHSGSCC
jgi:hypothetical protein